MYSGTSLQPCDQHYQCHWEKKYNLKSNQFKSLENQLDQMTFEFSEKVESLQTQLKSLESNKFDYSKLQEKLLKKRRKFKKLQQILIEREKEITILQSNIDFSNGKISNLRKCRQQSFDTISVLEAEIKRTQALCQTPTKPKKKKQRKSNPSMFEIKTQTFSFEITEVAENNKKDLEKIIENQSKVIQEEQTQRKNLKNQLDLLQTQKKSLESTVESLYVKIAECQQKKKKIKEKVAKVLKEKIEKLKIENSELRFQLREYEEKEASFWISDLDTANELSSIDSFPRSRNSEETIIGKPSDFKLKEKIEFLEEKNRTLTEENQLLQQDIEKRKKSSLELHKILQENQKMFESFKKTFNSTLLQQEINKLTAEKATLLKQIQQRQQELTKINEAIIYKKITEKQKLQKKTVQEIPQESSVLKSSNRQKAFPEDYKKRRNIGSWCCNFNVFPKN
jgi:hypothetical protein